MDPDPFELSKLKEQYALQQRHIEDLSDVIVMKDLKLKNNDAKMRDMTERISELRTRVHELEAELTRKS